MKTFDYNEKWYPGKYLSKYFNDALKAYWSEYSLEGLVINPTPDSQEQAYDLLKSSLQEAVKIIKDVQNVVEEARTSNKEIKLDKNGDLLVGDKSIEEILLITNFAHNEKYPEKEYTPKYFNQETHKETLPQQTQNSNNFAKAWSAEVLKTKIDNSPKIDYSQIFNADNKSAFHIENPMKEVKETNPKQINSPNSIQSSQKRFELAYERFKELPELKYFEPFNEKGEVNSLSEYINKTLEEYKNANEAEKENLKEKRAEINILLSHDRDKLQEIINEYGSARKQCETAYKEAQNQISNQQKLDYYKPKDNPLEKKVKNSKKSEKISDKEINELLKERELNEYSFAQKIHNALENQNNSAEMKEKIQQDLKDLKELTKRTITALEKNEKYQTKIAELNINLKNYDMLEGLNPNIELSKPTPLKQEFNLPEAITPQEIPSTIITPQENLTLKIDKDELQLNDSNISPTSTNDTRAFSPTIDTIEEKEIKQELTIKEEPKLEKLLPEELSIKDKMAMFGGSKKPNTNQQPEPKREPGKLKTSIFGPKIGDKTLQNSSTTEEKLKTPKNSAALEKLRNAGANKTTPPLQQEKPVSKWSTNGQRIPPKEEISSENLVISSTGTPGQQPETTSIKDRIAKFSKNR